MSLWACLLLSCLPHAWGAGPHGEDLAVFSSLGDLSEAARPDPPSISPEETSLHGRPIVRHEHRHVNHKHSRPHEDDVSGAADADGSSFAVVDGAVAPPLRNGSFANLVKNGGFEKNLDNWVETNQVNRFQGPIVRKCKDGKTVVHLHSLCRHTAGGIKQDVSTKPGREYQLSFNAYSGQWHGGDGGFKRKEDKVRVRAGSFEKLISIPETHQIIDGKQGDLDCSNDPLLVEYDFTATKDVTTIEFWAPQGGCVDIDDVQVSSFSEVQKMKETDAAGKTNKTNSSRSGCQLRSVGPTGVALAFLLALLPHRPIAIEP